MPQQHTVQDYVADAREYLEVSAQEFDADDNRHGAEKLYGAACSPIEEDYDIAADRPIVNEFIDKVLELADPTVSQS